MKYTLIVFFMYLTPVYADRTFLDAKSLGRVELRSEIIPNSSRVYLTADFIAQKMNAPVFCELQLNIKLNKNNFNLVQSTTLLPNEKIPYTLGVFPSSFHIASEDVSGEIKCRELPTIHRPKNILTAKKVGGELNQVCCQLSIFKIICSSIPSPVIATDYDLDTINIAQPSIDTYPPCYPPAN